MATPELQVPSPEDTRPICFSIMPFAKNFDDISAILQRSAERAGMRYVRGDLRNQPGSVMSQIIRDIRGAAVVIADVTGHNPNVFFRTGDCPSGKGDRAGRHHYAVHGELALRCPRVPPARL
jgi:hypothetical protein